jgi:hypothetical protein
MARPKKDSNEKVDTPSRKFISKIPGKVTILKRFDKNGDPVTVTDATGNGKVQAIDEFHWHPVLGQMLPDGKTPDPEGAFSFIIVEKIPDNVDCTDEKRRISDNYERLIEKFEAECKNPINKVFTEDDYQKSRNIEAFNAKQQVKEFEDKLADKDKALAESEAKIEELQKRLMGK